MGIISKYLDTISITDGKKWDTVLSYFGDLFTRVGIWIFIATIIATFSKTKISAAGNTFIFFIGVLISYYLYSTYLFGFFPTRYFISWFIIAIISPLLALIAWEAKNNVRLSYILPALPMGILLKYSIGIGLFYIYLNYIEELIMYLIICIVYYKQPKQMVAIVILSIIIAFFVKQIDLSPL
nr:hypothetical protein [Paenibacillus shirakamiensis]